MLFKISKWLFDNCISKILPKKAPSFASGGSATAIGSNCTAIGGNGGAYTSVGKGGAGGDVKILGKDLFALGGDGGNAAHPDGRGGRRTQSPCEKLNLSTILWGYGYGAPGANHPEYERRLKLLITIGEEYISTFPCDEIFIKSGIDPVPKHWINKRLEELGETWRVTFADEKIIMPEL